MSQRHEAPIPLPQPIIEASHTEPQPGQHIDALIKHLGSSIWQKDKYPHIRFLKFSGREQETLARNKANISSIRPTNEDKSTLAIAKAKEELILTKEAKVEDLSESTQSFLLLSKLFGKGWQRGESRDLINLPLPELLKRIEKVHTGHGEKWLGTIKEVMPPKDERKNDPSQKEKTAKIKLVDDTTVRKAKEGDKEAFSSIVESTYEYVYANALKLMKNPEDAMDVAQQAFIRAQKGIGKFKEQSTFESWLFVIVRNCSLNALEKRKRNSHQQIEALGTLIEDTDPEQNPEAMAHTRDLWDRISHATSTLSPKLKEIINLHKSGLTHGEIAAELEITEAAAKKRLHDARKKLHARMYPSSEEVASA